MSTTESLLTHSSMRRVPLVDRFQKEWERAEQLIANGKRTQYLLGFTAVVLVAGGIWAAALTGVPQCIVAAMTVAISIFQLFDPSKQIREQEKRLEGSLFNEVLLLKLDNDTYDITSSKIDVFKKFGSRCKALNLSQYQKSAVERVTIELGVSLKTYIEFAIEDVKKIREEPAKEGQSLQYRQLKCDELLKFYGEIKEYHHSQRPRGLSDEMTPIITKIREYVSQVDLFRCADKYEGHPEKAALWAKACEKSNQQHREKMVQIKEELLKQLQSYERNTWSITDLAEIISHCPNLKTITIDKEIQEIFGQCTGDKIEGCCEAHSRYTVWAYGQEKNPCDLANLRHMFNNRHAKWCVPTRF